MTKDLTLKAEASMADLREAIESSLGAGSWGEGGKGLEEWPLLPVKGSKYTPEV